MFGVGNLEREDVMHCSINYAARIDQESWGDNLHDSHNLTEVLIN
jgi:hypothetical protein